jgi:SulP family sulfate permease
VGLDQKPRRARGGCRAAGLARAGPARAQDWVLLGQLWLPALLISLVGFVESVSVAQSLALKRQQRIEPNRELLGLGAANLASAVSGGYPVTGGLCALGRQLCCRCQHAAGRRHLGRADGAGGGFLHRLVPCLPHAVLAATIIVAVTGLIDMDTLREAWHYDKADALSLIATALGVMALGVEAGILLGWRCRWAPWCGAAATRTWPWWAGCQAPSTSAT